MIAGALVFYADRIPIANTILPQAPTQMARYSTYRILSIIPVAYAAFAFQLRGGVITAIFVSLALLPRALFFSPVQAEALTETVAFFFIALLVSWLIHRQQRAVNQMEKARQELQSNVQVIQENESRLEALHQISSTVSESLELGQVLKNAIEKVINVMQVDASWIFLLDEKKGELVLATHQGISAEFAEGIDRIKLGEGFNGQVAVTGKPLYVEDATQEAKLNREVVKKEKAHSGLIVPLSAKGKVNGTLCIAVHSFRQFQPEEAELLTDIGHQIGIAIENAHLYHQQQSVTEQLRLSEERYRGLFENASEAILVCSNAGKIIAVNRACEQLTGYNQDELSATTIYELF